MPSLFWSTYMSLENGVQDRILDLTEEYSSENLVSTVDYADRCNVPPHLHQTGFRNHPFRDYNEDYTAWEWGSSSLNGNRVHLNRSSSSDLGLPVYPTTYFCIRPDLWIWKISSSTDDAAFTDEVVIAPTVRTAAFGGVCPVLRSLDVNMVANQGFVSIRPTLEDEQLERLVTDWATLTQEAKDTARSREEPGRR